MKYFKKFIYLIAATYFLNSYAGSYDDFFLAIERDDARTIQALLQRGFDPATLNPQGISGLFLALRQPAPKVTTLLLAQPRLPIDVRTPQNETPLMIAALKGQADIVQTLVERGADVNKPGWAPLHYAATGGHTAIVQYLLEHHAYIDAESPNGSTPLMMAAMYGAPSTVKLLLESGADVTVQNGPGMTALDFARQAQRTESAKIIEAFMRGQGEAVPPAPQPRPAP